MTVAERWKIAAVLLALCCIALVYRVVDLGLTRTYSDASEEASTRHIKLLMGLAGHEWLGLPEEQVMSRLKAFVVSQPSNSIVLRREPETNSIYLEGIRFEFRDGKLAKIS